MSIQNLIDELRKQLPGCGVSIALYSFGGGRISDLKESCDVYWGIDEQAKTPDEALQLLRQRLGLDGLDCPDCSNQGWYVTRTGSCQTDVEQTQCQFCWSNPQSKFSIANKSGPEGEK